MNLTFKAMAAVAALSATVGVSPAHANLIQNGSFESPILGFGVAALYGGGSSAITGWEVVGDRLSVYEKGVSNGSFFFLPQDGAQSVDLTGMGSNSKSNGLTQSFASVIGTTYRVGFYIGSLYNGGPYLQPTIDLGIDSGARVGYTNSNFPTSGIDWKFFSVDFVATSSRTSLAFFNGSSVDNNYAGLDNVSVEALGAPVPEPSEAVLMLLGLAALGARRRPRE